MIITITAGNGKKIKNPRGVERQEAVYKNVSGSHCKVND